MSRGRVYPTRAMSWLTVAVGGGLLICAAAFLFSPELGLGAFFLVWVGTAVTLVMYHLRNATTPGGVPHSQFGFDGPSRNGDTPVR